MMLGLASSFIQLADPEMKREGARFSGRQIMQVTKVSVLFVIGLYIFVKFSLRNR
jgi:hypothetical protein